MTSVATDMPIAGTAPARQLSQVLLDLDQGQNLRISRGDLINALRDRGFAPLLIIFALPNVVVFVPGSSVVTGLALMFIASQLVAGRPAVWLPVFLRRRSVAHGAFPRIVAYASPKIAWVERMVRLRCWPLSHMAAERIVGAVSLVMAVFMLLPIPFANAVPAISVIVLALGLSAHDGLWLAVGAIAGLVSTSIVAIIVSAGTFAILSVI
jgi:hypothetical protein